MGRRRFPEFKSTRELVRFIDDATTDLSQYDLTTIGEPVDIEIDAESLRLQEETEYKKRAKLRPITMRLDEGLVTALKRIATHRGMSYQTLARMWLRERTIEELRDSSGHSTKRRGRLWPQRVGEQRRVEQLLDEVRDDLTEVRVLLRAKRPRT